MVLEPKEFTTIEEVKNFLKENPFTMFTYETDKIKAPVLFNAFISLEDEEDDIYLYGLSFDSLESLRASVEETLKQNWTIHSDEDYDYIPAAFAGILHGATILFQHGIDITEILDQAYKAMENILKNDESGDFGILSYYSEYIKRFKNSLDINDLLDEEIIRLLGRL